MKRFRPWPFNFAVAVSLALCVAMVALRIYSFRSVRRDQFRWNGFTLSMTIGRGKVAIDSRHPTSLPTTLPTGPSHSVSTLNISPQAATELGLEHEFLGIGYRQPAGEAKKEQVKVQNLKMLAADFENTLAIIRRESSKPLDQIKRDFGVSSLENLNELENHAIARLAQINAELAQLTPVSRIGFPLWCVVLFTGILPAIWIWRMLHQQRQRQKGLCPTCGYDLRATPERCPECGAVAPSAPDRFASI